MTDYEHMIVSAVRYALGRCTYIVELTVNYILQEIEGNKLSDRCLSQIRYDIRNANSLRNGMRYISMVKVITKNRGSDLMEEAKTDRTYCLKTCDKEMK